jgi:hypothetical protein
MAAPMDALLSAAPVTTEDPGTRPALLRLELAGDRVNDKIDLLGRRIDSQSNPNSRRGDYSGTHYGAQLAVDRFKLEATRWHRALVDRADSYQINSWQLAGQFRLTDDALAARTWGLRASTWGNHSDQLERNMSTRFSVIGLTTRVNTIKLSDASDKQHQLDLIFTQRWPAQTLSAFGGGGISRVTNQAVSGTATINKCGYDLKFDQTAVTARPTGSCATSAPVMRAPNAALPYAAQPETNYDASYAHIGLSHVWQGDIWGTRFGIEIQHWQRDRIDQLIAERNGAGYSRNTILIGEVNAHLTHGVGAFLRTQFARHLFVGELPLAYNTITASRFGKSFSMFSLGMTVDF